MMGEQAIRPWCARMQYDGLEPFIAGTFFCAAKASQNIIEDGLWKLIDSLLPTRPKLLALLPGSLFFHPWDEKQ